MSSSDNVNEMKEIKELIDSFTQYRNVLVPLQESLKWVAETYDAIKQDLNSLSRSFSGSVSSELDKIHSTLNAQAKSGQELKDKIGSYADSGEKYARAVDELTRRFAEVSERIGVVSEIEKSAQSMIGKLDAMISEKRATYNLKELQRSLDAYNANLEKISDFINKDVAMALQENAKKIEEVAKENRALTEIVNAQGKSVGELSATFTETSALLRKTVESGSVNEEYLFDAFDKWAADRKVKIKKK